MPTSERQTEQRKNASDSSGTRCDVRITIPVIVISWSMSAGVNNRMLNRQDALDCSTRGLLIKITK